MPAGPGTCGTAGMKLVELNSLASEPHIEDDLVNRVGAVLERGPPAKAPAAGSARGGGGHRYRHLSRAGARVDRARLRRDRRRPARLHLLAAGPALRAYRAPLRAAPALAPVRFINGV